MYKFLNITKKLNQFNKNKHFSDVIKQIKFPKESNLKGYINFFRQNSYKYAKLDPLDLKNIKPTHDFSTNFWELEENEQIQEFPIDNSYSFNKNLLKNGTISELHDYLNKLYLNSSSVEFNHIDCPDEKEWLYENYESILSAPASNIELVNAFKLLYPADLFEKFLHSKFPTFKRYSGEGANTLLVLLYSLLSEGSRNNSGLKNAILAMPHRGRLNVLPLICDYPVANLLAKISGKRDIPSEIEGIDDVVSHIATSNSKLFSLDGNINNSHPIQISLLHNPSHLEAINPVAMGKSYAKIQDYDNDKNSVMNLVVHGDSAVSAQGVIYEALSFHKSPFCDLGGTIHIVTNNQIGYTTQNEFSRSTQHCTDIFKAFSIPIIHVNADDVEKLIKIGKLAFEYKKKFNKDIVINLICWRKFGHNEIDEPSFTQPIMYRAIKNKKESVDVLKNSLLQKSLINEDSIKKLEEKYMKYLNEELIKSKDFEYKIEDVRNEKNKGNKTLTGKWKDLDFPQFCKKDSEIKTGVDDIGILKDIIIKSVTVPNGFKIHPRLLQYFVASRLKLNDRNEVDWPGAEILAFASLIKDGFNLRLSGQDVTRGTFSQRHIGVTDQETNEVYYPLADIINFPERKGRLEVSNSSLSEMGVMLFDYGCSLESPKNFVIWEAQFGDFVNGAQV